MVEPSFFIICFFLVFTWQCGGQPSEIYIYIYITHSVFGSCEAEKLVAAAHWGFYCIHKVYNVDDRLRKESVLLPAE